MRENQLFALRNQEKEIKAPTIYLGKDSHLLPILLTDSCPRQPLYLSGLSGLLLDLLIDDLP